MEKPFNGLDRISLFAQELIALISQGKKESTTKIIREMENNNVVRYIYKKYKESFTMSLDKDSPYNIDDWEEAYHKFADETELDTKRRWGIYNEDDGLLLIVTITLEALRDLNY